MEQLNNFTGTVFLRSNRLLKPTDFHQVFKFGSKSHGSCFLVLYKKNDLGINRLGLAVSKKNLKSAVKRNLVRRIVRESFRKIPPSGFDVVVVTKPTIKRLMLEKQVKMVVKQSVESLLLKAVKKG